MFKVIGRHGSEPSGVGPLVFRCRSLKKENKKPSHTHTRAELMKLKCQGTSFAEDLSGGGPQKCIHLVMCVGTICRSQLFGL